MTFRSALIKMLADGEFEKIYKHANTIEKRRVKHDMEISKAYAHVDGTTISLLNELKSARVLKSAISYMMMGE